MSHAAVMDRNHLLMPVSVTSGGMSHSWSSQERSASQPLSPNSLNHNSPFPPSPILPSSSLASPPPTPFYLLPTSPLPSPEGGALPAAEFRLLRDTSARFVSQRRQGDDGTTPEDDDEQSVGFPALSTASTSNDSTDTQSLHSPSHSSVSSSTPLSSAHLGADLPSSRSLRPRGQHDHVSAPLTITPFSPASHTPISQSYPEAAVRVNAAVRSPFDAAYCYATTFAAQSPRALDADSPHSHHHRPSPRTILWPSLSPLNLPPVSALASLSFNCLDYSEDQLLVYTLHTFEHLNLVSTLSLSLPHLRTFLLSVRAHYRVNPYHNWYHGFHVFQFGYYMLTTTRLHTLLTPLDQLALLISCLCHDVDHPGTTNDFQIAIDSGLARVHNEVAVLENHHAFMTCEILRHPQCHFFTTFTTQQFRSFRKIVVAAILATDMAVHFELCRQFRRLDSDLSEYHAEKEEDRQLVMNLVVHSSDLSAQVMDFSIAQLWEARVTAEFIAQSEMEVSLGVPVTPLMVGLQDHEKRYEKHLGFLHYVMQPLWDVVSDVLPPMQQCVESLQRNKEKYRVKLKQTVSERDEERRPINTSTLSSSSPSSSSTSTVVSVTVTPSATNAPTPATLSPRSIDADGTSVGSTSSSKPATPTNTASIGVPYQKLEDGGSSKDESFK